MDRFGPESFRPWGHFGQISIEYGSLGYGYDIRIEKSI